MPSSHMAWNCSLAAAHFSGERCRALNATEKPHVPIWWNTSPKNLLGLCGGLVNSRNNVNKCAKTDFFSMTLILVIVARLKSQLAFELVAVLINFLLLRSTFKPKCDKKSAPRIGYGTATTQKFHTSWFSNPKFKVNRLSLYAFMCELFAP